MQVMQQIQRHHPIFWKQLSCQNQSQLQLLETAFQVTLFQKELLQRSGKNIRNLSRYRGAGPFLSTFDFIIHKIHRNLIPNF